MDSPRVVSQAEWLKQARRELLAQEKEATRATDAAAARRRTLPMVEIDKKYVFTGPGGEVALPHLFGGRRQLIVYHFMWRHAESGFPGEDQGCPTCSFLVDSIGDLSHLHACDTSLVLVSRAPLGSIERFRQRMGWRVPWYSSQGSDFNYDFHVSLDEAIVPAGVQLPGQGGFAARSGALYPVRGTREPGVSVFLREGDRVFHTYSAYAVAWSRCSAPITTST